MDLDFNYFSSVSPYFLCASCPTQYAIRTGRYEKAIYLFVGKTLNITNKMAAAPKRNRMSKTVFFIIQELIYFPNLMDFKAS